MSYYETPEQRRIRELTNQINRARNEASKEIERFREQMNRMNKERERRLEETKRRAEAAERKARESQETINRMSGSIRQLDNKVKEQERAHRQRINEVTTAFNRRIDNMNRNFEERSAEMQNQINSTRAEMRQGFNQIRSEMEEGFNQARQYTDNQISSVRSEFQEQISDVNDRISDIVRDMAERKEHEKELAEYWTQQAVRIRDELLLHRADFYTAREFQNLNNRINNALRDLNEGTAESFSRAISDGRNAFNDALTLLEQVTEVEQEWNVWFNAIKQKEKELLSLFADASARQYEVNIDGEVIMDDNGIDYWTNGQLSIALDGFNKLREQISDENLNNLNIDKLKERLEELIRSQEELLLIENISRTNVAMAQDRRNIALEIGQLLGEGYEMTEADGDYMGLEVNDEYHAYFKNPITGDTVAIVVTPQMEDDGSVTNHVQMEIMTPTQENYNRIHNIVSDRVEQDMPDPNNPRKPGQTYFGCSKPFGEESRREVERVANIELVREGNSKARK